MKIAAIADTHGRPFTIPPCDVFIHAGDLSAGGALYETCLELGRVRGLVGPNTHVLLIPGNHDKAFQHQLPEIQAVIDHYWSANCRILIDSGIEIQGKHFWGSPWTPPFFNWSFMAEEGKLAEIYKAMPQDLDVLITHGPPRGILDPGHDGGHAGSHALLDAIQVRRPRHHLFGHLHAAGGETFVPFLMPRAPLTRTHFHNVAAVDEAYNLVRGCLEFEI